MKMKLRTRYFILIFCLIFGGYFLVPTIKWYFLYTQQDKNDASLSGENLKLEVAKKVEASMTDLKEGKLSKELIKTINNKFIAELKTVNKLINRDNEEIKNYNKNNPKDKMALKKAYEIKKSYSYQEMNNILLEVKEKQKNVDQFFSTVMEDYYIADFNEKAKIKKNILKLGLDLQGGAYVVVTLNYDHPSVKKKYPNGITKDEKNKMLDSAVLKIENRINKYGISETSIQKLRDQEKIVINLPGVKEATELRQIIETVGVLQFKVVSKEGSAALNKLYMEAAAQGKSIIGGDKKLLPEYMAILQQQVPDIEVLNISQKDKFGIESETSRMLAVKKESVLGDKIDILNAGVQQDQFGHYVISFELGPEDTKEWANVTEIAAKNQDEIAIILDDVILEHPLVKDKIPHGRSQITLGNAPLSQLQNLALILRSGSLDVPLEISEEHTVGASLGKDTIEKGLWAALYGSIFVIIFMILYYSFGGFIADIAVALNIVLLMAGMALFHGTLTLPGIAGIILTIGMAVDANVIIFERVVEEFRSGKTFKTSMQLGYEKAFWTIMDANITTFAAGIGLTLFGTGPVKGFAVTLCLGIVVSLFTALFVTRVIFDTITRYIDFKSLKMVSFFRGR
jgi:protein-export membrane protein SecD